MCIRDRPGAHRADRPQRARTRRSQRRRLVHSRRTRFARCSTERDMTAVAVVNPAEHYGAYLGAIRSGDRRRAFQVMDAARDAGLDLAGIYLGIFQPALREIGCLWQNNELTVAEEHLATAITQAAMARAYERAFTWSTDGSRTLIAACADVERHE